MRGRLYLSTNIIHYDLVSCSVDREMGIRVGTSPIFVWKKMVILYSFDHFFSHELDLEVKLGQSTIYVHGIIVKFIPICSPL